MTPLIDAFAVYARPEGVVRVSGPDRLPYLHVMLSQRLEGAEPGTAADFLYLEPKGSALAAGRAVVGRDGVALAVPVQVAAALAAALERYTFMMQVEATDCTGQWTLASVRGPGAATVTGAPAEPMRAAADGDGQIVRDRDGGVDLLGPAAWVADRSAGIAPATAADWEAYRISAGLPAWGSEITPGRRAQELGLMPTHVHLDKGCYPGQESIAKIHNRGHARRALAVLEAAELLAAGDEVEVGDKRGAVTSAAPLGDRWVALALLPLDREGRLPDDGTVMVGGLPARIRRRVGEGIPQPGAPA